MRPDPGGIQGKGRVEIVAPEASEAVDSEGVTGIGMSVRITDLVRIENRAHPHPVDMWTTADAVPHIPTGPTTRGEIKIKEPKSRPWKRNF